MSVRSYFYNGVYASFRDNRVEDALKNAANYRTYQSPAGFRRIYDNIIRVLDGIIASRNDLTNKKELRDRYRILLAKLDITIQYQTARRVLEQDLSEGIKAALREISGYLQKGEVDSAVRSAESLRLALDAVLAYKIAGGGKREEEEEFL
ncbi:hypothetical protein ODS41_03260 [Pyrobaculum sp. 3827-6]|uniref:hypothetical protein n=1 Tax=Pyrobaculum sp. 3827-6 TaxID=2983604 RepID=UPI0021D8952C|nr:hypothetical protein [Pyrobaculum sp. 3827-6]MCU7786947.1 hypothetical protein [Pyrobaculum sp. 3827-6]